MVKSEKSQDLYLSLLKTWKTLLSKIKYQRRFWVLGTWYFKTNGEKVNPIPEIYIQMDEGEKKYSGRQCQ